MTRPPAGPTMRTARPLARAVYSINVSMAAFVVGDVFVKMLGRAYPPGEVIFWRSLIVVLTLGVALTVQGSLGLRNIFTRPVLARCAFDCINIFSFVIAIAHLNMAELYAIILTSPVFMTLLEALFFNERVGWRRWLGVLAGFAGVLLIVKPDSGAFNSWAALGVLSALSAAGREVVTRKIDPAVSTSEVTLVSAAFAAAAGLAFGIVESWKPMASSSDGALIVLMAAGWVTGVLLLVHACRIGPLSIVASFRYTLLLWGGIAGYFVFGDVPDRWSVAGAVIIVLSGFGTLRQEARPSAVVPGVSETR
jgi:drug/metabolite transporter (DMT)-like permease